MFPVSPTPHPPQHFTFHEKMKNPDFVFKKNEMFENIGVVNCQKISAAFGMYRLAVKWGVFDGKDPRKNRKRLKVLKNAMTFAFLALGLLTFAAYTKIGIEHRDRVGERYVPSTEMSGTLLP